MAYLSSETLPGLRPAQPLRSKSGRAAVPSAIALRRGQPGYGSHLDADGDGIAYEPWFGGRRFW